MSKRKLNQDFIEIAHILMDDIQKQAKIQDTQQVLSSFEVKNGAISPLKGEYQENDPKVEKEAKTEDTHQVLSSFEIKNGVISPLKSEYRQENDPKLEKQAKIEDTQQVFPSFEVKNGVVSPPKSEHHQQNEDTHQVLSSSEVENGVISPPKSEYHQQDDPKLEKQTKTHTLYSHQRQVVDEKDEDTNTETHDIEPESVNENDDGVVVGPRERLNRHRKEVAGQVWIPELWGQENLLQDWVDCSVFDKCLMTRSVMSARASLIEEGRRANSRSVSVENSC